MNRENIYKETDLCELEFEDLSENVKDLKYRLYEDASVYHMMNETEEESSSQKKLKEIKKFLADAAKMAERAEKILAEVIREREKENRKVEDAILLKDGTTKVNEKKSRKGTV